MKKFLLFIAVASTLMILGACNSSDNQQNNELGEQYQIKFSAETINPKPNKRVLIISASPRKAGNTDLLADEFMRGAKEAGAQVEKIFLGDYDIKFYTEPESAPGESIQWPQDDAQMITNKMVDADVIVLASPVYFMNINGQLKTLIDRTFSRFMEIKDKECGSFGKHCHACNRRLPRLRDVSAQPHRKGHGNGNWHGTQGRRERQSVYDPSIRVREKNIINII